MSSKFAKSHGVVDINAQPCDLYVYAFLPEADGTFAGCYVDVEGRQTGSSFTAALTGGTAFTFRSIGAIPADAVGFLGRCTCSLRVNRAGTQASPYYSEAPDATKNFQIPATESLIFGRVSG